MACSGTYADCNPTLFYGIPYVDDCVKLLRESSTETLREEPVLRAVLGAFFDTVLMREACIEGLQRRSGGSFIYGEHLWEARLKDLSLKVRSVMERRIISGLEAVVNEMVAMDAQQRCDLIEFGDVIPCSSAQKLLEEMESVSENIPLAEHLQVKFVLEDHLVDKVDHYSGAPHAAEALCRIWKNEPCEFEHLDLFYTHMVLRIVVLKVQEELDVCTIGIVDLFNRVITQISQRDSSLMDQLNAFGKACADELLITPMDKRKCHRSTLGVDMGKLGGDGLFARLEGFVRGYLSE